ncbi:hypothetical protein HK100_006151 [Physocladia obscura]|uniref:Uncharacterized protein n=1 Tax=Physocladia obscura TaxID=109957 RepID=A0AAD5SSX9_9FUNG|nr:hypothetical protein HK100_006151 [Physocladia obscura]
MGNPFVDNDSERRHTSDEAGGDAGAEDDTVPAYFEYARRYAAVPEEPAEEAAESASASASASTSASVAAPGAGAPPGGGAQTSGGAAKARGLGTDAVFANLRLGAVGVVSAAAAGDAADNALPDAAPPAYRNVFDDSVTLPESSDRGPLPVYDNAVALNQAVLSDDGDVLVDGLPVGDFFSFFANLFVSMSFDFFGYLMTTMLATSHAARCGSRSGLGITFIRYGMLVLEKDQEVEENTYRYDPDNYEKVVEVGNNNDFIAYIMIIFGFFLMMRANADYVKAQRIRSVMLLANTVENSA